MFKPELFDKNYHYTYRIDNIKMAKSYIGVRTSKIHPEKDLGIKYFSHSTDKNFMVDQRENPENYKYLVIEIHPTRSSAIGEEISLHVWFDVGVNPKFYNRVKQTSTSFDTTGIAAWNKGMVDWHNIMSKEVIEMVSKSWFKKGNIPWNKGKSGIYSLNTLQKNIHESKRISRVE